MVDSRRSFFALFGTALTLIPVLAPLAAAQRKPGMPDPPAPADPSITLSQQADPVNPQRTQVMQRQRDFRANLEKLYQLVGDVRTEVQNSRTTGMLSVHIYKQTEEIEKLAKQVKNLARS